MLALRGLRPAGPMKGLDWRVALLLTVPPLMWASNAIVGRLVVGHAPPLGFNVARWLLAAVILLPLGWRIVRHAGVLRRHWRYLLVLGLSGVGAYNALQYMALQTSTAINVTLIAASTPMWTLAVGALFYGQHPRLRDLAGAGLSLVGVGFVLSRGDPSTLVSLRFVIGDVYVLVAVVSWAFYSWLLARPPARYTAETQGWNWAELLLLQILFGLVWAGGAAGVEWVADDTPRTWVWWLPLAMVYVAVGPALIGYRCWSLGMAASGPATATLFANMAPVFAAIMSLALLGESPSWYHGLAFLFIIAGIVVSSR